MPIELNPFDDDRLAKIRAGQTDPIVQYFIVRKDISMSIGKIGSQIAHGAEMFVFKYESIRNNVLIEPYSSFVKITKQWFDGSFRKVVLGGKKKDFDKIIKELNVFLVRDAGLTEVEPNSETVIVTWPMLKSTAPKCISKLQVLC